MNEGVNSKCVGCEQPRCAPEAIQALVARGIKVDGFTMISVGAGEPFPFVYTVGLTETFNHPEFIMQGAFHPNQMVEIIAGAIDRIQAAPDTFKDLEVPDVIIVKVRGELQDGLLGCQEVTRENKLALLCRAAARYGDDGFVAKQLIFPDQNALLPWIPGFNRDWGKNQARLYSAEQHLSPPSKCRAASLAP